MPSTLDAFTLRHLQSWFDAGFSPARYGDEDDAMQHMLAYLGSLDASDLAYALETGWTHVYDASLDWDGISDLEKGQIDGRFPDSSLA